MESDPVGLGWCIVELMGHRRLGGRVSEHSLGGANFVKVDVPATRNASAFTQLYAPGAIYCLTPTSEALARQVAEYARFTVIEPYELPGLTSGDEHEFDPVASVPQDDGVEEEDR